MRNIISFYYNYQIHNEISIKIIRLYVKFYNKDQGNQTRAFSDDFTDQQERDNIF